MAWVVEADGVNDLLASTTLGDLISSKVRVVVDHATIAGGYVFSQAGSNSGMRELGLWITAGSYQLFAGGSNNTLATVATYPIVDSTVDVTVDYVANTAILIIDGVTAFNGAISAGTGRVNGQLFRMFARNGGFYAPAGSRVGNSQVYINDILVRNYDFDGSSHGTGTVTIDETISSADFSGVNMPTDGSAWVDLGGSGISITVDSGSYSVTGTDVNLKADYKEIISTGSYAYTGTDIILVDPPTSQTITIDPGSYSLTGANLSASIKSQVNTGSYSITGTAINFAITRGMTIDTGSYIIQGTNINFSNTGNIWTDKPSVATLWGDKAPVITNWTDK